MLLRRFGSGARSATARLAGAAASQLLGGPTPSPPSLQQKDAWSPLHIAAQDNAASLVASLLDTATFGVNDRANFHDTALHCAARTRSVAAARQLLARGADPNATNAAGMTPLHIAATDQHATLVEVLLSAPGIDVGIRDKFDRTALHAAAESGAALAMSMLLDRSDVGVEVVPPLLHICARGGHVDCLALLLDRGADPNRVDRDHDSPLLVAVSNRNMAVAKVLLDRGADANSVVAVAGWTALHQASKDGDIAFVRLLLDRGAALDAADRTCRTPLHLAALCGHAEVVAELLRRGADINAATSSGRTALHVAAEFHARDVIPKLLAAGANTQARDNHGRTPLQIAEEEENSEAVALLLAAQAK